MENLGNKKLFIETLGCAMNTRDTEHIIAELNSKDNYETTEDVADADLIIINTCSVREKPVAKLFSELGQFKKKKKPNPELTSVNTLNTTFIENDINCPRQTVRQIATFLTVQLKLLLL